MAFTQFEFPHTSMYDSDLRELIEMYNKLISSYDTLVNGFEELTHSVENLYSYVDSEIAKGLAQTIAETNSKIHSLEMAIQAVSNDLTQYKTRVYEKFELERQLTISGENALRADYTNKLTELAFAIAEEIADLQKQIDEISNDMPKIFNPVSAKMESIEDTVNSVWQSARSAGAINASLFDAKHLTCEQLSAMYFTCLEFAVSGKKVFAPLPVYSPITGKRTTIQNALTSVASIGVTDVITCAEFDTAGISAEVFDAMDIETTVFDFKAKTYII